MKMRSARGWGITVTAAGVLAMCLGCTAGVAPRASENPEGAHLGKLGTWADEYAKEKKHAPKNIDQLKDWAKAKKSASDEDFVSTRDHEPYQLRILQGGSKGKCIIFEATGDTHTVYMVNQGSNMASPTSPMAIGMMTGSGPPTGHGGQQQRGRGGPGGAPRGGPGGPG